LLAKKEGLDPLFRPFKLKMPFCGSKQGGRIICFQNSIAPEALYLVDLNPNRKPGLFDRLSFVANLYK